MLSRCRRAPTKAYWWRKIHNFGDAINPVLLEGLFGLSTEWSDAAAKGTLACVGSIISHAKPGWVVWGAGLISADIPIPSGLTVLAVRGPLSRDRLNAAGYRVPSIFGDPGLLMPLVRPLPSRRFAHDWGIIPHLQEFDHRAIRALCPASRWRRLLAKFGGRRAICINPVGSVRQYLAQFSRCRAIASSSLHGLIMAEAYGKPAVWLQLQDGPRRTALMGGAFKFRDFYEGIGKAEQTPVVVESHLGWDALNAAAAAWRPMDWDPLPLLDAFPDKTGPWATTRQRAATYFRALAASGRVLHPSLV